MTSIDTETVTPDDPWHDALIRCGFKPIWHVFIIQSCFDITGIVDEGG